MKPLIVANWKMQLSLADVRVRLTVLQKALANSSATIVICPSFTALETAKHLLASSPVHLGAQDVFWKDRGAFTGEVSPTQLTELGVEYVIIGHSERRGLLQEDNVMIGRKAVAAMAHGLLPILCVGEIADERAKQQQDLVVRRQLQEALRSLPPPKNGQRVAVAYEPVWAIGTGESANPEQALEMHRVIHQILVDRYGSAAAEAQFQILYGGSVTADNVLDYVHPDRFTGVLAGTASLEPDSFVTMINNVSRAWR